MIKRDKSKIISLPSHKTEKSSKFSHLCLKIGLKIDYD